MVAQASDAGFEQWSWHDNTVYGLRIDVGDPARGDWRSDLVLDIDHIVEWVCGVAGGAQFRVAPATLTFHDVTDLRLDADWGDSGGQTALNELSIDAISRERLADQKICLDRPYYRWSIAFNWPKSGCIAFCASGFTLNLRAEPVLLHEQRIPVAERL